MENTKGMMTALTILAVGLVCSSVYGQEKVTGGDEWQISFIPYFWAPDIDVKSTVSGATAKLDLSFSDIIDNFDAFGFSGRVEMHKGDWGLFFDGAYVDLDGEFKIVTPAPTINVDVDIEDVTLDFGIAYKLFKVPLEDNRKFILEVGYRYFF